MRRNIYKLECFSKEDGFATIYTLRAQVNNHSQALRDADALLDSTIRVYEDGLHLNC